MKALLSIAENLRARTGWRRAWAAFAFGLLGALAFPPTNIFPLLWISFPAFLFLLRGAPNLRAAFVTGWCFAFGYFLLGLYWIAAAMFVDIAQFWWGVPLAVAGLPAVIAIYYGTAAAIAHRIGARGLSGCLTLALMWFLADYARGHLLTGFPWNLEGYVWTPLLPMLLITSVTGIYGLTLLTLITAFLPACLAENSKTHRAAVAASLAMLAALGLWGALHMGDAGVTGTRLRIVQPNVDQAHKWIAAERESNFQKLLDLSFAPADKVPLFALWPETASTFYLTEDPVHRRMIASRIAEGGAVLTGVVRVDADRTNKIHYYNSLLAIRRDAHIEAVYDKFHLVPFGEYIPFRSMIPIRTLAALGVDFSFGPGPRTLTVAGLPPLSPLICYEAIFPGEVTDPAHRPALLLNITNDGWYGKTAGPYQHFAIARVRAIEEGLPLARAANTGISGMIDPYGRITARLGLGETGFVDADIPQALPLTFFGSHRELALWIMFALAVVGATCARRILKSF